MKSGLRSGPFWLLANHTHLARFIVVGSFNTLVDLSLYFILANILHIYPVLASIFSTSFVMFVSFNLNHRFVFQSSRRMRHTALLFIAATLFSVWGVQSIIVFCVLHVAGSLQFFSTHQWTLNLVSKICGVGTSFILNFIMYRRIFRNTEYDEAAVV